ncbi:MAG: hypothetical protein O2937_00190 [Bacteroidetes bacterium]|nr:hypothetical protein [Bacteroidota bacterium]
MAKEIVVIRREIVLRVNYLGILVCSATAINRGVEGAIDFWFIGLILMATLLFVNARILKKLQK